MFKVDELILPSVCLSSSIILSISLQLSQSELLLSLSVNEFCVEDQRANILVIWSDTIERRANVAYHTIQSISWLTEQKASRSAQEWPLFSLCSIFDKIVFTSLNPLYICFDINRISYRFQSISGPRYSFSSLTR